MSAVEWLLLDVGGVLSATDDDRWPAEFLDRTARRSGLTTAELVRRLERADLPDATTRSGVEEELWRAYATATGADAAALAATRADFWDAYCGEADETMHAFVRRLRGRVGLAILSNSADGARREEERRFGFSAFVDPILYSHELGVAKPDPAAFRAALAAMAAEPEQVVLVDDRAENVAAAEALGIRGVRHVDAATTVREVERLLGEHHLR